jgi:hypothetical protein
MTTLKTVRMTTKIPRILDKYKIVEAMMKVRMTQTRRNLLRMMNCGATSPRGQDDLLGRLCD